ncbi:MAG TPA: alpha-L-arabinofuranosidase C-terminal domain-containing protein [Lacipirellulaceae bacterium]|jgi:alpha-N-arabinofuranosidase
MFFRIRAIGVVLSLFLAAECGAEDLSAKLLIHVDQGKDKISRHIYGQFAEHLGRCIYDGFWVGNDPSVKNTGGVRDDVVAALRELAIPNLRWPGGCFADNYHWRDGIGPPDKRPERSNVWWGNVPESNRFGTHEFLGMCAQLGCEPLICGNVGSGSPQELEQWIEYVNADRGALADERRDNGRAQPWHVKFWGVGNESWGCGGNMRPEYYADVMDQFTTFMKPFGGTEPFRIACGASDANTNWTDVLMQSYKRKQMFQGLSLHYYTLPTGDWKHKGSATDFEEDSWISTLKNTLRMEDFVKRHSEIMDKYDPQAKVALVVDEWGTWYDSADSAALFQQNTLRDALVAGINLNIFNNHCRRVRMASIAQTVNVLQSMILTKGAEMVLTPSYYVFRMYKPHQDATMLPTELTSPDYVYEKMTIPALTTAASRDDKGAVHVSLTNADPHHAVVVECSLAGADASKTDEWKVSGEILTAGRMNSFNDFGKNAEVKPTNFDGAKVKDGAVSIELPGKSIVMLAIENLTAASAKDASTK